LRRIRLLALVVAAIFVLLAVAQLVLPGIAAQNLRDRLAKSGQVLDVQVHAFPAIELLWHQADRVVVRVGRYRAKPGHLQSLLAETADTGSLDASATELDTGLITLRNATLHKRGDELTGTANVTNADLSSALGGTVQGLRPVASGNGELTFQGTVLGVTADATLRAQNGALVIQPDVPLLDLVTLTVFSAPRVEVQGVGATPQPAGFAFQGRARLH
jgi:hypothetical protein